MGFLTRWGLGLLLTSLYTLGGAGMIAVATWKKMRFMTILPGLLVIAAGIVFHNNRMVSTYALLVSGILLTTVGIYQIVQRR